VRIWIDLSNSPHPLLFAPIARRLAELGHQTGITARDNAQTVELTLQHWPDATVLGGESPHARALKAARLLARVAELRRWAQRFQPDLAVSHNSYAQIVAAKLMGIPAITAMDYEGQPANHLAFRLADAILLPEALRGSRVSAQGASAARAVFYGGLKEEIYLGDFEPDPTVRASIGVAGDDRPLVVARTPPSRASYHRFDTPLFTQVLEALSRDRSIRTVLLVRHPEQRRAIPTEWLTNIIMPEAVVDTRSLMYEADLVIGGGGTMTREAALLGVPSYSAFGGKQPAVDRELEAQGRLGRLRHVDEILPVRARKAPPRRVEELRRRGTELVDFFADAMLARGHAGRAPRSGIDEGAKRLVAG
jgi:predicted glycosyltransferase